MEEIEILLSIAATVLGLVVTTLTFLTKFIKNARAKKALEDINNVSGELMPLISRAEDFIHFSGAEKKEYVLTKANQFAIENGINFDKEEISQKIEELVQLSRQVNKRDRDKLVSAPVTEGFEFLHHKNRLSQ